MDTVYVETTVIGNIAGRLHPDPRLAERQRTSREWWLEASNHYDLFISQLTVDECSDGDPNAAAERLNLIEAIPLLDESSEADDLAELLIKRLAIPKSQPRDALHIAIAAIHEMRFLVTWNFKHILNPHLQKKIAETCHAAGYFPPVICTPQQLLEADHERE